QPRRGKESADRESGMASAAGRFVAWLGCCSWLPPLELSVPASSRRVSSSAADRAAPREWPPRPRGGREIPAGSSRYSSHCRGPASEAGRAATTDGGTASRLSTIEAVSLEGSVCPSVSPGVELLAEDRGASRRSPLSGLG